MFKVMVITLSDRAYNKIYEDESGRYLVEYLEKAEFDIYDYFIIDDDREKLTKLIEDNISNCDLIITTGGTGLTNRDIGVEVVEEIMDYEVRGMSVALHQFNLSKSSSSMFSRAICAVKDQTMIITLPGSLKAVKEIIEYLCPHLSHGLKHLNDINVH